MKYNSIVFQLYFLELCTKIWCACNLPLKDFQNYFGTKGLLLLQPKVMSDDMAHYTAFKDQGHYLTGSIPNVSEPLTGGVFVASFTEELLQSLVTSHRFKDILFLFQYEELMAFELSPRLDILAISYETLDCSNFVLREHYSIFSGMINKTNVIGTWDESTGFVIDEPRIWERRKDLSDLKLTLGTKAAAPFVAYPADWQGGREGVSGYVIYVVEALQSVMYFDYDLVSSRDGFWGGQYPNGSWNGLVADILSGHTDMIASSFSITTERSHVLDFNHPIYTDTITCIMSRAQSSNSWNFMAYFDIFTLHAWFGCMATSVVIFAFTFSFINDNLEWVGAVLRIMVQQSTANSFTTFQQRCFFMTFSMFSVAIFAHYSALLTSTMTAKPSTPKLTSFTDVANSALTLLLAENAAGHNALLTSQPGSSLHQLYLAKVKDSANVRLSKGSPTDLAEAIANDPNLVLMEAKTPFLFHEELQILNFVDELRDYYSLAFKKDSELMDLFNYHILKLETSGVLDNIWRQAKLEYDIKSDKSEANDNFSAIVLSYGNLFFPFAALVGAFLLSGILAICERCLCAVNVGNLHFVFVRKT